MDFQRIEYFRNLLKQFKSSPEEKRYNFAFPIAVYDGTRRIGKGLETKNSIMNGFRYHGKCFTPHSAPNGMTFSYIQGASGILEVYDYEPIVFKKVIEDCDSLNGFIPDEGGWYYLRTLMEVHLLPQNYSEELYEPGLDQSLFPKDIMDLRIPVNKWKNYCTIPCWVYSNAHTNREIQTCWCMYDESNPTLLDN